MFESWLAVQLFRDDFALNRALVGAPWWVKAKGWGGGRKMEAKDLEWPGSRISARHIRAILDMQDKWSHPGSQDGEEVALSSFERQMLESVDRTINTESEHPAAVDHP